jgi:hypothetical protein
MRRYWVILSILLVLLIACRAVIPETSIPATAPAALPSPLASPTARLHTPAPERATPTPLSPTAPPVPAPEDAFAVRLHPDGPLYVGDQVSLEIIAPRNADMEGQRVEVQVEGSQPDSLGPVDFGRFGIGGRSQATLLWAWDTSGLPAGDYDLAFAILPDGSTWTETVSLLPQSEVPAPEPQAEWAVAESDCCLVHYITGTAAERDLEYLLEMADEQAENASQRMGTELADSIPITFLPRVLGHGGFTSEEISVSYLDRNYAGSSTEIVLHHEMIHLLDGRLGGDLRPTLFVEGLAVYLTGGHFKPEPLMPRAAALLEPVAGCVSASVTSSAGGGLNAAPTCGLSLYLPLAELADHFYFSQHEIGYLQAGALVEYMVENWGWQAFSEFYRDIHLHDEGQGGAIEAALQEHFGLTLAELENGFVKALGELPLTPELVHDVRLTVLFYDTVRRYQMALDMSVYFLTAWLPDNCQMR